MSAFSLSLVFFLPYRAVLSAFLCVYMYTCREYCPLNFLNKPSEECSTILYVYVVFFSLYITMHVHKLVCSFSVSFTWSHAQFQWIYFMNESVIAPIYKPLAHVQSPKNCFIWSYLCIGIAEISLSLRMKCRHKEAFFVTFVLSFDENSMQKGWCLRITCWKNISSIYFLLIFFLLAKLFSHLLSTFESLDTFLRFFFQMIVFFSKFTETKYVKLIRLRWFGSINISSEFRTLHAINAQNIQISQFQFRCSFRCNNVHAQHRVFQKLKRIFGNNV